MTPNFDQMVPGSTYQNVIFIPRKSWKGFQVQMKKEKLTRWVYGVKWSASGFIIKVDT